jgi:hypothetical protein
MREVQAAKKVMRQSLLDLPAARPEIETALTRAYGLSALNPAVVLTTSALALIVSIIALTLTLVR